MGSQNFANIHARRHLLCYGAVATMRRVLLLAAWGCATASVSLDWVAQFSVEDKTMTAAEEVVFSWTGTHNVEKMASYDHYENCDFDGATMVGSETGAAYGPGGDGEVEYFACSVSSHCDWGQKVAIEWAGAWRARPAAADGRRRG